MKVTLKQLDVFTTVAREGSVTKAAERLHLTQSATSMALSDLETQLGEKLFDRIGRRLKINALGQRILPMALQALTSVLELEDACQPDHEIPAELRLSASLTVGNYLLPTMIGRFVHEHPHIDIQLQIANTQLVIAAVKQYECDIGFIEGVCHEPDIEVIPWMQDHLVVFCGKHHPLARQQRVTFDDLSAASWVLREPGSGTREAFDEQVAPHLSELNIRMALGHGEAIRRAVETGLGLGFASKVSLEDALRMGSVVVLETELGPLERSLFILRHRQKYHPKGVALFLDALPKFV